MKIKQYLTYMLFVAVLLVSIGTNTAFAADKDINSKEMITVAVTMEKFTLGQGYIIEPVLVTMPKDTQASVVITDLLEKKYPGIEKPYTMTGSIKDSFYLASIYDPNQKNPKIPQYILDVVGDKIDYSSSKEEYLGEFNYFRMSGWMYAVGTAKTIGDSSFPNVGASAWPLQDGQVMRWQFTIYGYGADLNADNSEWGTKSIVNCGDKDDLIWKVAKLNSTYDRKALLEMPEYKKAMEVLTDPQASQDKINNAVKEISLMKLPYQNSFTDLNKHWAKNNIAFLSEKNLIKGKTENIFKPDDYITRAEFAQILFNMAQRESERSKSAITNKSLKVDRSDATDKFSDVKSADWFSKAVEWSCENGVAKGMKSNDGGMKFCPNANITREDMAVMIKNYVEMVEKKSLKENVAKVNFADEEEISSYAKEAVLSMQKSGLIKGIKKGGESFNFEPKTNATRSQAATMIANYLKDK